MASRSGDEDHVPEKPMHGHCVKANLIYVTELNKTNVESRNSPGKKLHQTLATKVSLIQTEQHSLCKYTFELFWKTGNLSCVRIDMHNKADFISIFHRNILQTQK